MAPRRKIINNLRRQYHVLGDIASLILRRLGLNLAVCRREHILDEYSVAACRVIDHHVRDSSDELAVLDDRRAAQECGQ